MILRFLSMIFCYDISYKIALSQYVATLGGIVAFSCNVSDWGDDTVSLMLFYKDGLKVPFYSLDAREVPFPQAKRFGNDDRMYVNETTSPPSLVIKSVKLEDEGDYRCRVDFRDDKTRNSLFSLKVVHKPKVTVNLGANLNPNNIKEGIDVILECNIIANPNIFEIGWTFNDNPVISNLSDGLIVSNNFLVLQKVKKSHRGNYQCIAINSVGEGRSNHFFLRVQFAPICKPDQQLVYPIGASEETLISCSVDADPDQISFKWYLNSSSTNYGINNYTVNETTSYLLYSPKNRYGYGSIYCTSSNSIGHQKDPCSFNIIPPGIPVKVENCTMKNQSLTGLLVDCSTTPLTGPSPIYIIDVYKAKTREKIKSLTNRDRPTFLLQDLSPQGYYELYVYSKTTGGQSDPVSLKASLSSTTMTHNQMKQDITREDTYSPLLVILMAIVGTILIIIIMIILAIRIKSHRVEVTDRRQVGPSTAYYDESKSYPRITQKEKSLCDLVNIDKSLPNGDISCFQNPYDYHNIKQTIEMTLKQNKLPIPMRSTMIPESPTVKSYQLSSSSVKVSSNDQLFIFSLPMNLMENSVTFSLAFIFYIGGDDFSIFES
ncbi:uncharacterized protein LOC128390460 [Panonychus citri]|uniref:uncharacterized protein LOC128390460 n=1 Tax=Panonychus citri TaxID=50023 RepID=UPI00230765A4|nr:uncharacterized protein LOC128390460 [Panonychus citri]